LCSLSVRGEEMIWKCLSIDDIKKAFGYAERLLGVAKHGVLISVSKKKFKRSSEQNKYYWGVVVKMISDETGYEPAEVHDLLKGAFLQTGEINIGGIIQPTYKSTASLDTAEFEEFLERCRRFASMNLSLIILLPNESEEMWK